MFKKFKHLYSRKARIINWGLIALILLVNGYTLLAPLWPQVDLWKRKHQTAAVEGLPYKTKVDPTPTRQSMRAATPKDDRLIIPDIALNDHIITGSQPHLINMGVWARPNTSTPPAGSNTVLIAHRYNYTGADNFYSLGSVKIGDPIVVYWQGKEYDYTVTNNQVMPATDLAVEDPSSYPKLTLYTCTPIWEPHPQYRIVVTALLDRMPT